MSNEAPSATVHPSAIVDPGAQLGPGCAVGPFSIVGAGVVLGAGTSVGSHCELGVSGPGSSADEPLVIGAAATIRSHSVFYTGSRFGDGLVTGHRVTVREGTVAGVGLQIGTLTDIQGDCRIGDHVRTHSNVHIGKHSTIGNFVWIFPYVVLTNDPHPPSQVQLGCTIEDYAAIATMSVVLPGVTVGTRALVGAHSSVSHDVAPGRVVAGSPARDLGEASRITLRDGTGRPAYPWTTHFSRGYPASVVAGWSAGASDEH